MVVVVVAVVAVGTIPTCVNVSVLCVYVSVCLSVSISCLCFSRFQRMIMLCASCLSYLGVYIFFTGVPF